jgi:ssDNA-binding replication factor A large subunit
MTYNYSDTMKIGEIKRGMSNITVEGKVVDVSESRQVQTRYGKKNVADATIEDDSGQIGLSLWENQISAVTIGNSISVSGAYVTEFRDKLQLNIPKSGKLEVLG